MCKQQDTRLQENYRELKQTYTYMEIICSQCLHVPSPFDLVLSPAPFVQSHVDLFYYFRNIFIFYLHRKERVWIWVGKSGRFVRYQGRGAIIGTDRMEKIFQLKKKQCSVSLQVIKKMKIKTNQKSLYTHNDQS